MAINKAACFMDPGYSNLTRPIKIRFFSYDLMLSVHRFLLSQR